MKFLCDQCKAKYQISDDKVVGKTVRMKCRKCGHMIEVRAAVTETSVSTGLASLHPPAPTPGKSPLATSFAQAKPPAPRANKENSGPHHPPAPTKEDEAALLELATGDDWYAAINGAPAGPMRIGDLRRHVAEGAVTEESLVWKDGMEEWRPLRSVPELAQMIREAALKPAPLPAPALPPAEPPTAARARTLAREPATNARPVAPPAPARPAPPRPAPALQPPRPGQIAARSNVVPFGSRTATAEKLEEIEPEPASLPPPPAVPQAITGADPFQLPASAMVEVAPPPPAAQAPAAAPVQTSLPAVAAPPPRQPNYVAIGMIVGFAAFGVTLGLVFRPQPPAAPPAQIIVQQVPVPQIAPSPVVPTAEPVAQAPAEPVATAQRPTRGTKAGPGTSADATKTQDLHDLNALLGPGMGPGAGPSTGGSGGTLSTPEIEAEVNRHKIAVRRTCFERLGSSAGAANEMVHVSIGGDGHISSANAEGNNGVVGTCLEKEVRNWVFPARGGTTKVDLPFHFVLQ